jgi:hypothetical protein
MHHLPALIISNFTFYTEEFCMIISLNSVTQLISVMETCCVFFEVQTEFLNI